MARNHCIGQRSRFDVIVYADLKQCQVGHVLHERFVLDGNIIVLRPRNSLKPLKHEIQLLNTRLVKQ